MIDRYAKSLLFIVITVICSIAAFNWLIDPYAFFSSPGIKGINGVKTEADKLMRINKAYAVKRELPDTVIVGTSRALYLDSMHPVFKGTKSFNLALTSSSSYEVMRYIQHAHALSPLKSIIYGLDYDSFHGLTQANFSEKRLSADSKGEYKSRNLALYFSDLANAIFTLDALKASIKTIKSQPVDGKSVLTVEANMAERVRRKGGQRKMFMTEEFAILSKSAKGIVSYPDCEDAAFSETLSLPDYRFFRTIVRQAYRYNVSFKMFISPVHARFNEVMCASGKWLSIEKWKRKIIDINDEEAELANKPPYPLWDFSGYNKFTAEAVPPEGDLNTVMRWYMEGTHYSKALGDVILNRIYGEEDPLEDRARAFGSIISSKNIEDHLKTTRDARESYIRLNGDDVTDIKNMADVLLNRPKGE